MRGTVLAAPSASRAQLWQSLTCLLQEALHRLAPRPHPPLLAASIICFFHIIVSYLCHAIRVQVPSAWGPLIRLFIDISQVPRLMPTAKAHYILTKLASEVQCGWMVELGIPKVTPTFTVHSQAPGTQPVVRLTSEHHHSSEKRAHNFIRPFSPRKPLRV